MTHILSGWTCGCGWHGASEDTIFVAKTFSRQRYRACPKCQKTGMTYFEMSRETANKLATTPRKPEMIHGIPVEWPEDHNPC
jgi:hypothetical protein